MIAVIKKCSSPNLWYSEAIGFSFEVFMIDGIKNIVFPNLELGIFLDDVEIIYNEKKEFKGSE